MPKAKHIYEYTLAIASIEFGNFDRDRIDAFQAIRMCSRGSRAICQS